MFNCVSNKKFIYLIIIFLFIISLSSCTENIEIKEDEIIIKEKAKEYYEINSLDDFYLDLSDLVVFYKRGENEIEINDYDIYYDNIIFGENIINIKYKDCSISFTIFIKKIEGENSDIKTNEFTEINLPVLKEFEDRFYDEAYPSILDININDFSFVLYNSLYGKTRTSNTLIVYDLNHFVETNIYGYELLVDEFGCVIEANTNVTMTKQGQTVLSAHGERISELKKINIGDYILFINDAIYVYKNINNDNNDYNNNYYLLNKSILILSDLINYSLFYKQIKEYDIHNKLVKEINDKISVLEKINFKRLDDIELKLLYELEELDKLKNNYNIYDCLDEMIINDEDFDYNSLYDISIKSFDEDYILYKKYEDKLYYGGFRDTDTLVYYDKEYYRSRNKYGYEIAMNKDGIVIDKGVLVDITDDVWILSGHSTKAEMLKKIDIGDLVIIKDDGVYFYKKILDYLFSFYHDNYLYALSEIKGELDYNFLYQYKELINYSKIIDNNHTLYSYMNYLKILNSMDDLTIKIYASSMTLNPNSLHGMWYYPFSTKSDYDKSIEGINEVIKRFKIFGINEVFIDIMTNNGCLFDNPLYKINPLIQELTYDGYKDYLECFIDLCHKNNIKVTAFTQTFMHYSSNFKDNSDYTYQVDFSGERSKGSVYYLDICNDNITDVILEMYKVLVNYDFDNVEYDIIRYSESNLYKYNNTDSSEKIEDVNSIKDPGYTEYAMNDYINEYNINHNTNFDVNDFRNLIINNKDFRINWLKYKENKLINFITKASKIIKNKGISVSAAILSNYQNASRMYLQDYKKWASLGIVDSFEVMNYQSNIDNFRINNEYYFNDKNEYIDKIRIGISNQLNNEKVNGENFLYDLIQMNDCMDCGYVIYSNNLYLYNDKIIDYLSLINR